MIWATVTGIRILALYEIHNWHSLRKVGLDFGGPVMRGVSGECRGLQQCCHGNNLNIVPKYCAADTGRRTRDVLML